MEGKMKFIVLAKYTKLGTDGWLDNPDEDRKAMVSGSVSYTHLTLPTKA